MTVESPYYGAYVAAATLANGTHIVALDTGTTPFSGYLVYQNATPIRALLYNSNFFSGTGTRESQTITLNGLQIAKGQSVVAKRLTAPATTSEQGAGVSPTFGGQSFVNTTCGVSGTEVLEEVTVVGGTAKVVLSASEALLLLF